MLDPELDIQYREETKGWYYQDYLETVSSDSLPSSFVILRCSLLLPLGVLGISISLIELRVSYSRSIILWYELKPRRKCNPLHYFYRWKRIDHIL